MALVTLESFYPDYREGNADIDNIKTLDVYAEGNERVGTISDILVEEQTGRFRYFVVDTGFWIFGKKVLLPVGLASIDYSSRRISVNGLTKQQIENLPNFENLNRVDYDYEEQVRGTYRTMAATPGTTQPTYNRDTYNYDQEPDMYNIKERDRQESNREGQNLKLYEERLIADKERRKTGEVAIGKHVESEQARVSVPVEKERVVIERTNPSNATPVAPGDVDFREGEVARMEIHEENAAFRKEAVVREEVNVKKVVDRDTKEASETVRREELDIDAQGRPTVDKRDRQS
ncbi:MAG: DUF2382 domain-containing protein [Scytonema sp. PMC 1069.18]|nr:DUF2382 domain-containing protein [Scytonema sp. PMC 1069.18]MEC4887296.1 DUF2382 domain-containing protein [Scytonema sp. PMC 1070.18]